jgi:DMSO/TMAO reductase YedYZ molybdopterin-dependent catalytic subunit
MLNRLQHAPPATFLPTKFALLSLQNEARATAGIVYGPYEVKGVLLQDICDLVGGIPADGFVSVNAPDGYSMAIDYDQIYNGGFLMWEPETLHEVTSDNQIVLLTYEWDGGPISHNDGAPLRLAVVSDEAFLTEGHNWVKWVDEI